MDGRHGIALILLAHLLMLPQSRLSSTVPRSVRPSVVSWLRFDSWNPSIVSNYAGHHTRSILCGHRSSSRNISRTISILFIRIQPSFRPLQYTMGKSLEVPLEVRPRGRRKSNLGNSFEAPAPWGFAATIKQLLSLIRVIKRALGASEINFEQEGRKRELRKIYTRRERP